MIKFGKGKKHINTQVKLQKNSNRGNCGKAVKKVICIFFSTNSYSTPGLLFVFLIFSAERCIAKKYGAETSVKVQRISVFSGICFN